MTNSATWTRRQFVQTLGMGVCAGVAGLSLLETALAQEGGSLSARTSSVYAHDAEMALRKSQDNPRVTQLYEEFLKEPNSHEAHRLCHTQYVDRSAAIEALKDKGVALAL